MPKEKSPCKYLSTIMLDSVIKANKKLQICSRKDKNWEVYWWRFRKKEIR